MKIRDLDGNVNAWKTEGTVIRGGGIRSRSQLHLNARSILQERYPTLQICEEVRVQLRYNKHIFIDFYINTIKTVIEVHGSQHYKFNSLYHSCAQDFLNQKKRDNDLRDWCNINNLNYIELPFNEDQQQWQERLKGISPNNS